MEKREPSYTVAGNVNGYNYYAEQYGGLLKLKIELSYDSAIPLLGIYPEKTIIQKDTFTLIFIAALFTIAKTWKQSKCPTTDEWIKKMWYRDFPGGPVGKTQCSQCRGPRFDPWSGN